MRWLKDRGVVSSYEQYATLPYAVLQDCRLLMEAEAVDFERQKRARELAPRTSRMPSTSRMPRRRSLSRG